MKRVITHQVAVLPLETKGGCSIEVTVKDLEGNPLLTITSARADNVRFLETYTEDDEPLSFEELRQIIAEGRRIDLLALQWQPLADHPGALLYQIQFPITSEH